MTPGIVDACNHPLHSNFLVELLTDFRDRAGRYEQVKEFITSPDLIDKLKSYEVKRPNGELLPVTSSDNCQNTVRLVSFEGRLLGSIVNIGS